MAAGWIQRAALPDAPARPGPLARLLRRVVRDREGAALVVVVLLVGVVERLEDAADNIGMAEVTLLDEFALFLTCLNTPPIPRSSVARSRIRARPKGEIMKGTARFLAGCSLCPFLLAGVVATAMAQDKGGEANPATLDAAAARSLVSDRVWEIRKQRGPGHDYWSWKADGSVCLRLGEKAGKCADTGQWKLTGDRLCYELSWWGATQGMKSNCFRIADQGKGRYAWLQDNTLTIQDFTVLK